MNFLLNILIPIFLCIGLLAYGSKVLKKIKYEQKQAIDSNEYKPDSSAGSNLLLRFFLLIFGVFGIFFFLVSVPAGIAELLSANPAANWATEKGKVFVSEIVTGSTGNAGHKRAKIRYKYTVTGKNYISGNIDSVGYARVGINTHYVEKYPRGASVTVYYNPENPAQALLEPGKLKKTGYSAIVVGVIFLVLGICSIQAYRGKIEIGYFQKNRPEE